MTWSDFRFLVRSDLHRLWGDPSLSALLRALFLHASFKYVFWFRTCCFAHSRPILKLWLYPLAQLFRRHLMLKLGIDIPYKTTIGPGLHIGHCGGIVVNELVNIGKNCNLSHGVTIGQGSRAPRKGCPSIGDNVYIGPGAKLFGNISIGNNAAIGANAVVMHDVPDNAVAVGIPAKVVSARGSEGYVCHTDYA